MLNLILTNKCNIQCPFCFASESKPARDSVNEMTVDAFWEHINKFKRNVVRFCGGERTVHPNFVEMLDGVLEKDDLLALILTNGIWPKPVIEYILKISMSAPSKILRVRYLFNLLNFEFYSEKQRQTIDKVLNLIIPDLTTIGYTIYKPGQDYRYLIDIAVKFKEMGVGPS